MTRRRFLVGARFQKTEAPILKVRSPMVPIRSVVLGSREQVMAGLAGACRCRRYDNVLSRHPSRRSSHRPRFDLRIRRPPMSAMGQADKPSPAKAGLCPLLLRKRTKVGAALRVGKSFLHVCSIGRCSHVFGLLVRHTRPLAIMPSADQVPIKSTHSTMRWHKWVVLIAGSTGSALRAVRPPNLHITPDVRRDLVYAASATGSL